LRVKKAYISVTDHHIIANSNNCIDFVIDLHNVSPFTPDANAPKKNYILTQIQEPYSPFLFSSFCKENSYWNIVKQLLTQLEIQCKDG
jgi:hypothetical protein